MTKNNKSKLRAQIYNYSILEKFKSMPYSWEYLLMCIFVFVMMFFIAKPRKTFYNPRSNNIKKNIGIFFILFAFNNVFALWEYDTYHYWDGFGTNSRYAGYVTENYEAVYNWLAAISGGNYFLWRTYIWLPASILIFWAASKLKLSNRNFLLAIILFGATLSYTRGMLGHAMLLMGVVLFVDNNNKYSHRLLGIIFFVCSYFFHKSMFVNIAFAILAFLPQLTKRKYIIISLIAFPFLTSFATYIIDGVVSGALNLSFGENVGGVGDRTVLYASAEKLTSNLNGIISMVIEYFPQYLTLWYLTDRIVFKEYFKNIPQQQVFTYLFKLTFVCIYIASLFMFVETSSWIYMRFKYMGFFPLVLVLAKVFSLEQCTNKWIKAIIILKTFAFTWDMAYRLYSWY